jgi:hydroxymethylbilane synthase
LSRLRVATRGSALARWQAERVAELLLDAEPALQVEMVLVETSGDRRLDVPIWELGGKGVFAKEVQAAVLEGRAELAVHSAKDLPSVTPPGLVLACVPERGDPRDALVGASLAELPQGAEVATGSLRRQAQLAALRPDLRFVGLRGNMQTRLAKAEGHHAIVVAATALDRLGLGHRVAERLDVDTIVPQVAQAALAVECRQDDGPVRELLERIEDPAARRLVDAERGFLVELGGDCSLPAAAHARYSGAGGFRVDGVIASADGRTVLRHRETAGDGDAAEVADPAAVGRALARHLLDDQGGRSLLSRP